MLRSNPLPLRSALVLLNTMACSDPPPLHGAWALSGDVTGADCVVVLEDGTEVTEREQERTTDLSIPRVEQHVEELEAHWETTELQHGTSSSLVRLSWTLVGLAEHREKGDRVEFFVSWSDDTRTDCLMEEHYWGTVDDGVMLGNVESKKGKCTPCASWVGTWTGTRTGE